MIAVFPGSYDEALDMMISLNLSRRHLDLEELRIAAGKLATLTDGQKTTDFSVVSRETTQPAISRAEVAKAVTIERKATPEVKAALGKREITQGQAFEYAKHEPKKQRELVTEKPRLIDSCTVCRRCCRRHRQSASTGPRHSHMLHQRPHHQKLIPKPWRSNHERQG